MSFTVKQQRFIEEYTVDWNATQAAIRAGYSEKSARKIGSDNYAKADIRAAIEERTKALTLEADEILKMKSDTAKFNLGDYVVGLGGTSFVDIEKLIADGHGRQIKGIKYNAQGAAIYEFHDPQKAQDEILKHLKPQVGSEDNPMIINVVRVNRGSD